MQVVAAFTTRAVEGQDVKSLGSATVQDKLIMDMASGTALVDRAIGKALLSAGDDGLHSEAGCSTATGFSCRSVSSTGPNGIGLGSADCFVDLLEDVGGDREISRSSAECQPTFEDSSMEFMEFSQIILKLNQESGLFRDFPGSVLVAAAPKRLGDTAPIVFCSKMFETSFGHIINDTIVHQCMFDIYDAEPFRDAISEKRSQSEEALAIQVAMRNNPHSFFRMKLVDVDDEPFVVAVEDTAHAVERWDALMSEHFFYSAPMERQLLDQC
jgi:hypothetical protein